MKNIVFIIVIIFIMGCDPPHNILFVNSSESDLSVNILRKDSVYTRLEYAIEKTNMKYFIKPKDTLLLQFGIGTWSEDEIKKVTSGIEKIEIETKNIKTTYKSKTALVKLFNNNVKGWVNKRSIIVNIEE